MVDSLGLMARRARSALVPDGQHMALSELQGDPAKRPAVAAHCHIFWRAHCFDLVLLPAGPAGTRNFICQYGYRDSCGGYHPALVPSPAPIATAGASNWLACMPIAAVSAPLSQLSEARRSWEKK